MKEHRCGDFCVICLGERRREKYLEGFTLLEFLIYEIYPYLNEEEREKFNEFGKNLRIMQLEILKKMDERGLLIPTKFEWFKDEK